MTADRWRRVKALFDEAVERNAADRAEFLDRECGDDADLRAEVERLLAGDQDSGLLDEPVLPSASRGDPMVGRRIGNYVVTGELARGGMGVVYRGRHVSLPREVVVKCIRPGALSESARDEMRLRFRREAHIQSQLDHPHIVRVYEFFTEEDECFLVMEYVPGSSLRSLLDERHVLPAEQAANFAVQALGGLAHAHTLRFVDESGNAGFGIVHRDIKPANLLVDEAGHLKVTDFGIAKPHTLGTETATGWNPGTLEYMSPEQIRGLRVDPRSDLYSLGVTLYEMLSGATPFGRVSSGTDAPPLKSVNPAIESSLAAVVDRSLRNDPDERWQTADDFRAAVIEARRGIPSRRNSKAPVMIAALAVLVVIAVATVAFWANHRAEAVPNRPSIAVLPFADLSPEKDQGYFSDGLAEELLNSLANTPGLLVTAKSSSFRFNGTAEDIRSIGRKLNVGAVLEGSVRKQGNRARISVELVKAADGFHLWSETYERKLTDIFAVQQEIARAVAGALEVKLLGGKARAKPAAKVNGEAYNPYLQGRYFLARHNKENLDKATHYFEEAIRLDPGYARAWAGLGEARSGLATASFVPVDEGFRNARTAVQRAIALDPELAEAHAAMGWIQMIHDEDWAGADASYRKALELEPGNATIVSHAAILARIVGRLDEAVALGRRAIEMDPLSPGAYHNAGVALRYAGLNDEAAAAFQKTLELHPGIAMTHSLLGEVYLAQSRLEQALAEMEKEPRLEMRLFGLALAYHALGRKKESDENLAKLLAVSDPPSYQIAEVYPFRGETERAFEWLEKAFTEHGLVQLNGDPLLKNIRNDPRYVRLLERLRLPRSGFRL
jgi:serine/threonine-protein kinase